MSEQRYSLGRVIGVALITSLTTLSVSGLVVVGADRQRLKAQEDALQEHIRRYDEKVRELDILKENQVASVEHLKNIDNTLIEIKAELLRMRR